MPRQTVETRIERLEQRVTAIEQLPARMDRLELQIVQLRSEVRGEFSAIRDEAQTGTAEAVRSLRAEIRAGDEETRRVLREEIRGGDEETRRVLREEFQTGYVLITTALVEQTEELRRHMRVLFEEAVSRIAYAQENRPGPPPKKKR